MRQSASNIYVALVIPAELDAVWQHTQIPQLHEQWDLRFTSITYLPRPDELQPQRFLYATRLGLGLKIEGEGETAGNLSGPNGQRTSALKFWSADPKSLIREGAGYWKYTPTPQGILFETGYDYNVRFGWFGKIFDRVVFRPLIGWATAWSFDRLRLWLETGQSPSVSLRQSLIYALARLTVAFVWLYHGLVPKLIFHQADELTLLQESGLPASFIIVVGLIEVALGLWLIFAWRSRFLFVLTIVLMVLATVGVALSSPHYLIAAFNPVTLNILMIVLSVVGLLASSNLPSASHCRRQKAEAA